MSNKGAIKKTTTSSTVDTKKSVKTSTSKLSKTISTDSTSDEKTERKKKEVAVNDTKTTSSDKKNISNTRPVSKNIPTDKSSTRLKQSKNNGLLSSMSSKSSLDEPSVKSTSSVKKKQLVDTKTSKTPEKNLSKQPIKTKTSKTPERNSSKPASESKTKTTVRKDKVQAQYSEKRGESTLYVPKSRLSVKAPTDKSLKSKKSPEKVKTSRERRKSRTLSPSEVKVLRETPIDDDKKVEDVDAIADVGVDDFKVDDVVEFEDEIGTIAIAKVDEDNGMDDCEEDFEEYESNFESYSGTPIDEESDNSILSIDLEPIILRSNEQKQQSVIRLEVRRTDEENMLDSGHYELTEAKKRAALVESLMSMRLPSPPTRPEPRQATNQSYREEKSHTEIKSLPSSTDEGFEDARSDDVVISPPVTMTTHEKLRDKEVKKERKKNVLTRGQILMSMIKLDSVGWSLYECQPISYDEYIRSFGKLNAQQASTQTNEDNVDVEIQTDSSEMDDKWTQFPVKCRHELKTSEDVRMFKIEHIGVGSDDIDINIENIITTTYDALRLNEFLVRAGRVMLALLEEKESGGNILQNETHGLPFSEGFVRLSVGSLSFLAGRTVTMLHYSELDNKILVSVHAASNEQRMENPSKQEYITECCIGCVWNMNEPSRPTKLFYSQNPVTACCFHCSNSNVIFAGLQDGSICAWDLREDESWHQRIVDKVNEIDWVIRSPTYTTAGNWEIDSHLCPVIAIRILSRVDREDGDELNDKFASIQICSLDENGRLIIWSVLRNFSVNADDLGLTPWGKVKLVKSQELTLFLTNGLNKEFVDLQVDSADSNNLYLATSNVEILHANSIGGRSNKYSYRIGEMDSCGSTTCMEVCPFKESYFLAGCKDGSIRLHTSNSDKPLLKLKNEKSSAGVKNIQWSKTKPMIIYVLDEASRIVIWDLSNSDVHPTHQISTKSWAYVRCMRLSPCNTNRDMQNQYLALGTDRGHVEVHKLKKNFHYSQQDDFLQEMNKFLKYVSVL